MANLFPARCKWHCRCWSGVKTLWSKHGPQPMPCHGCVMHRGARKLPCRNCTAVAPSSCSGCYCWSCCSCCHHTGTDDGMKRAIRDADVLRCVSPLCERVTTCRSVELQRGRHESMCAMTPTISIPQCPYCRWCCRCSCWPSERVHRSTQVCIFSADHLPT